MLETNVPDKVFPSSYTRLSSLLFFGSGLLAFLWCQTPFLSHYTLLVNGTIQGISFYQVVNDGLMTGFFFLTGLGIKKEMRHSSNGFLFPIMGATGGVLFPALIYVACNGGTTMVSGWTIPTATDIVLATKALGLFGNRVPRALTQWLESLAVFDDIVAMIFMTLLYGHNFHVGWAAGMILVCLLCSLLKSCIFSKNTTIFLLLFILWILCKKTGLHATLSGVVVAFLIPKGRIPSLEQRWEPWVSLGILPLFMVTNLGVSLQSITLDCFKTPLFWGVFAGLSLGKPLGVLFFSFMAKGLRVGNLPVNSWKFYTASTFLTGIGFTMSLFLGNLWTDVSFYRTCIRSAVILASCLSCSIGIFLLQTYLPKHSEKTKKIL